MLPKIQKFINNTKAIFKLDKLPKKGSDNLVTSGGIAEALDNVAMVDTEGVNALLNRYVIVDSADGTVVGGGGSSSSTPQVLELSPYLDFNFGATSGTGFTEEQNARAEELMEILYNAGDSIKLFSYDGRLVNYFFWEGHPLSEETPDNENEATDISISGILLGPGDDDEDAMMVISMYITIQRVSGNWSYRTAKYRML